MTRHVRITMQAFPEYVRGMSREQARRYSCASAILQRRTISFQRLGYSDRCLRLTA